MMASGNRLRHRLLLLFGSLVVVLGTLAWAPPETGAEGQVVHHDPPVSALPTVPAARSIAAAPLTDYAFYPPTATGTQPVRLLVVLHGMGGSGPDMATGLLSLAQAQGWAVLAPTMPYRDFRDPELVRQDGALLPRLKALIDDLPGRTGLTFGSKVVLFGFSRGSQEAIRFSLMYPDVTLGVAGLSAGSYTLPATTYKLAATDSAEPLRYPFGTADVATICGRAFDPEAARRVAYWIGVGGTDTRVEDVPRQWDRYVGDDRVERARRYVELLQQFGARATFELFPNAGHEVTEPMRVEAVRFLASLSS
ncbi:MAG: hypothetical protein M3O34_03520 [Chloroflexota bacterium]|nr:hypothetical protein [Chloroflexota bacterium]